jgi:hypothetical protein
MPIPAPVEELGQDVKPIATAFPMVLRRAGVAHEAPAAKKTGRPALGRRGGRASRLIPCGYLGPAEAVAPVSSSSSTQGVGQPVVLV